jgi:hypothetical protein
LQLHSKAVISVLLFETDFAVVLQVITVFLFEDLSAPLRRGVSVSRRLLIFVKLAIALPMKLLESRASLQRPQGCPVYSASSLGEL